MSLNTLNHKQRGYFKSDDEFYFHWYLCELMDLGYIDSWGYEVETFELSEPIKISYIQHLKTKSVEKESPFLGKCTYSPDFKINWNKKAEGILYYNISHINPPPSDRPYFAAQDDISRIEIKPSHDFQNKTQQAVIKIKWLYQLGTYVQLVIPRPKVSRSGKASPKDALFNSTFVPKRFLLTDKDMKERKIRFEHKTFDEWEDTRQ